MTSNAGERRAPARRTAEIDLSLKAGLAECLLAAGWIVRPWLAGAAAVSGCGLLVLGAHALPAAAGAACVAVLVADDEAAGRAASVTPYVYALGSPVGTLARLLARAADAWGRTLRRVKPPGPTAVGIHLGEEVQIDGVRVPLGLAERNFLFTLAFRSGAIVAKDAPVPTEQGRAVKARECRRRLGKRLGSALASLLVPEARGEPYRLATRADVERDGRFSVRILGRSSVRTTYLPDTDDFPE